MQNEVSMLMSKAYPASVFNLNRQVKDEVTTLSRKDIKSLTQTYTGNTSLDAILIVTITFAAACFSSAMCSSLAVASICVIARWEDLELLLYNRSFTKKLMWFAYMATWRPPRRSQLVYTQFWLLISSGWPLRFAS